MEEFEAPKTCGNCGVLGHNRATCTNATVSKPPKVASGRVCHNCGGAGHNVRTCTQPKSNFTPVVSSTPKKTRKCGNCGEYGHNSATCLTRGGASSPSPSPAPTPQTVSVVPEVISTPANITQSTTTNTIYGIDISKMKVKEVRGLPQYETAKGTFIFFPEINVTRQEAFMNTIRRIGEVVKQRNASDPSLKLVFKYKEIGRESQIVPRKYESYARKGSLPGSYPKGGSYYWDLITYMIEHSEFEDPKFEYIGKIQLTDGGNGQANGNWEFFSSMIYRDDQAHPNYEEYDDIDAALDKKLAPQIDKYMKIFAKRSDAKGKRQMPNGQNDKDWKQEYKGNAICFKCNPLGDDRWRQSADMFMTTEDIPSYKIGQLGYDGGFRSIPKGTLIPLGGGCEFSVNPIDVELLASLYGTSRVRSQYQNQWQNPLGQSGWGFKVMDMNTYMTRVFGYYNKKLDLVVNEALEYKNTRRRSSYRNDNLTDLKEFQLPDSLVMVGGISYKALNPFKLNKLIDGAENYDYTMKEELKKVQTNFMRKAFPDTEGSKKTGAKGIYENGKAQFLLGARMFSHTLPNGEETSWLQPGNRFSLTGSNPVGGIETFINEYESEKENPEFFIEVEQPLFNDDGEAIKDEDGDIETETIKLPNPEKLKELYALDGGIIEILKPDDVRKDVEDAIDFVRNLDANNLPPILLKYYKTNQILNPQQLITKLEGVTRSDKAGGPKIAQSIWQIYTIYKLQERREVSYAKYLEEEQERFDNKLGVKTLRISLTKEEDDALDGIGWNDGDEYFDKGIITDDERNLLDSLQNGNTNQLLMGGGKESVLYYEESSWDKSLFNDLKIIVEKIEVADVAERAVRERALEVERSIKKVFNNLTNYSYSHYARASFSGNHYSLADITYGEDYTNKEIFELLGLDYPYTESQMAEIEDIIEPTMYNYKYTLFTNGLFKDILLWNTSADKIRKYYQQKQLSNIGVGVAPTIATPTTITPTVNRMSRKDSAEMSQMDRDLMLSQKQGFPYTEGHDVKGYLLSVTTKVYNRPYYNDTVYVGVITDGNSNNDENGHYLNFAFKKSELELIFDGGFGMSLLGNYLKGRPVELNFNRKENKEMWGRMQSVVKVSNMRKI